MLSLSRTFLFIHIPKTAGNAIQSALQPYSEDELVCTQEFHDGVNRFDLRREGLEVHKHSTLADYQRQLPPGVFAGLYKFTCVRNPWERCISFYFSPHRGDVVFSREAFAEFVESGIAPAHRFAELPGVEPARGADAFDHFDDIIRFETLQQDFAAVCRRLDLPAETLPRLNVSRRQPYSRYYDAELANRVARRFAPEIERFGYRFDDGA